MATDHNRLAPTGNRIAIALVVSGIVSLLTLGTAFGLLALGVEYFWVAFPVGFGGVLPVALGLVALWSTTDS
jgi:hypothetical protein